jgi:protein-disulfide isomerase
MSKRQEIREKRRRERIRNQVLVILFIVAGALLITFALIMPTVQGLIARANATDIPVTTVVPREIIAPVDGTSMGDPDAPVRMESWEDFQCPACVGFSQSLMPQVITAYVDTGLVYYTFRFYPFIGKESEQAANAAMCASEQDLFWDYHDILFANWNGENQGAFADERLVRFAEVLELDMDVFNGCFEESRYQAEIDQDFAAEQAVGGRGTPFILVDGVRVINQLDEKYVPGYEDIAAAIEAALAGK